MTRKYLSTCYLTVALSIAFLSTGPQRALAAPFSTSEAYRTMQGHQSKKDQGYRIQAIESYFLKKNPGVSKNKAALYARTVEKWASHYSIDPFLVASILVKESTVRAQAVSKGNYGLMQINWKANSPWIVKTFSIRSTKELLEPSNNIRTGAHILSANIRKSKGNLDGGLDRYRGRSLTSYRNIVHSHYTEITKIFRKIHPSL